MRSAEISGVGAEGFSVDEGAANMRGQQTDDGSKIQTDGPATPFACHHRRRPDGHFRGHPVRIVRRRAHAAGCPGPAQFASAIWSIEDVAGAVRTDRRVRGRLAARAGRLLHRLPGHRRGLLPPRQGPECPMPRNATITRPWPRPFPWASPAGPAAGRLIVCNEQYRDRLNPEGKDLSYHDAVKQLVSGRPYGAAQ